MTLPLEKDVQAAIVALFRSVGGIVYSTSQGYRHDPGGTRCTAGIPDLYCFLPRRKLAFWWETKRPGGKRTKEQDVFAQYCVETGQRYGWGDLEQAKWFLDGLGVVRVAPLGEKSVNRGAA